MNLDDVAANMFFSMEPLRGPIVQAIINSSNLPEGSHGLDVGCGIGLQTLLLAEAAGPKGHIAGIDFSPSFLEIARELARQAGLADQVSFQHGSWDQIPYDDRTFDWVWSLDAACYAPNDPLLTIHELARVIKPGGKLILGYWSSQSLLPGYPALEARLNATPAGIAPFMNNSRPDAHYLYTLNWMQQAAMVNTRSKTFVWTVSTPQAPDLRKALAVLFEMRWGMAEHDVSVEDWQAYLRLCREESPEYILDRPGYTAFFTYSVFCGSIPEG